MVKDSIGYWLPGSILGIQSFAHHVNMSLLSHLTGREQAELKIATAKIAQVLNNFRDRACLRVVK